MSDRRRLVVLAALVLVVAAAVLLDAAFPQRATSVVASQAGGAAVAMSRATSTAWYCPGPLPVGARSQASSIAVANLSGRQLRGSLRLATSAGTGSTQPVVVPAHAQLVVSLPRTGRADWAAATVLLAGGGAAVEQVVDGPRGTATSPCSTGPASTSYFPAGSTSGPRNLTLALFDPSATPAVASVTISTGSSTLSPASLQDLSIGAGQVVVVDVGRQAPQQQVIGTTVTASAGELVTGALLVFARRGGGIDEALTAGSGTAASRWWFGPAPLGPSEREIFAVLDPGGTAVLVQVLLGGGPGAGELRADVPAGGVVQLAAAPTASSSMSWASVTSLHGGPIVVARETVVSGAASGTAGAQLAAGTSVQLGLPAASSEWVLPGGRDDTTQNELLVLANPGRDAATISVQQLGSNAAAGTSGVHVRIAAGGETTVLAASLRSRSTEQLALVVRASCRVLASSFLSSRSALGGLAAVDAIPVSTG